jgi:hypothetical protein
MVYRPRANQAAQSAAGGRCPCCGTTDVPLDIGHIQPLSGGGTATPDNLEAVCPDCRRMLDVRPSQLHFTDFLTGLIRTSERFRNVQTEVPLVLDRGTGCVRTSLGRIWRIYLRGSVAIGMRWLQSD